MDKYEYKLRADEIRALIKEKKYREAVEIADTIDWRNVRNGGTLCSISDLYKICKRYSDSRDVLLLAYQRNPGGRAILYSLCELSIKLNDIMAAMEYYKEYSAVAPKDPGRFILNYKIYTAMEASLEERIAILEELKLYECKEKWMYELAYLYHMQGVSEKCVEECNQIVLFFGDGKYVLKALELKSLHEPLSAEQDILYRRLTEPKENDVLVKDMDVSKFNTIDLQKELANGVAEVLFDDTKNLPDLSKVLKAEKEEASDNADTTVIIAENPEENEEATENLTEENIDSDVTPAISIIDLQKNSGEDYEVSEEDTEEDTEHTKVLDTKAVERALGDIPSEEKDVSAPKGETEAATSRTVIPQRSLDDMHEVMPKSSTNSAIVFPNYDDMVSMEGDGQISFNVPEQEMVEKQITGQISIAEVLLEWERMKNANEKKWREDMRRKVIAQTKVLFREFDEDAKEGLLEKLEEEVTESETVELTHEEQEKLYEDELPQVVIEEMQEEEVEESVEENAAEESHEEESKEETEDSANEQISEEESEEESASVTEDTDSQGDIKEIILGDEDKEEEIEPESEEENLTEGERLEKILEKELEEKEAEEKASEEPTAEELSFDRTQFIETAEENQDDISAKEPEASDNTEVLPQVGANLDYLLAFAEAGDKRDISDLATVGVAVVDSIAEEAEDTEEVEEIEKISEEPAAESTEEEVSVDNDTEETETEEEADTVEDTEETEAVEEEQVSEPEIRSSGFTLEQERRFEAFIQTEVAREQLLEALSLISMESDHGNAIIGSDDTDSSVELAKAIMMELSDREGIAGKVAKIKASTLNAKDAEETLTKLYEGALIIQDAHELRPETLMSLQKVLAAEDQKFFVILTCIKRLKNRFISENRDLLTAFDISIDIEALSDRELVAYAKSYAYNRECTIDEMGTLALHRRIEEKQTNEHAVTVIEVKAIIDAAIAKASKKNVKHFVDVLLNKKYDENDMTVLKEKHFLEKNKE